MGIRFNPKKIISPMYVKGEKEDQNMVKRIMDHTCLKAFDHFVVMNENRQMIGWIKKYFNGNGSNPDKYTTIEVLEFDKDQIFSEKEPKRYVGFNDDILHGNIIFGVLLNDHSQIDNQLRKAGLLIFNMTP